MAVTRIVLADDHEVVRSALRLMLSAEKDLEVVAEAGSVDGMLEAVDTHRPDVLVLDLTMPGTLTPLEALPQVRERSAGTATVVLTMQDDPRYARTAFRAGALAYVLKDATGTEFVAAVRHAAQGELHLSDALGVKLALLPEELARSSDLSDREAEVLRLLALGHTNAEMGEALFLSVRTIESHRASLQHKLGLSTRAELVRYAMSHGLLGPG
jgi:two-component system response regulator NreC